MSTGHSIVTGPPALAAKEGQAAGATGRRDPLGRDRRRRRVAAWVAYLFTFVVMFPLLWIVLLSFQSNAHILSDPFSVSSLRLSNYRIAVQTLNLLLEYKNTFILAVCSVSVGLVVSFMSSYALTRMVFKHRRLQVGIRYFFLAGLAVPVYVLLFPVYRLDIYFHVFGTYVALILPYIAVSVPFNTLLLTGFLVSLPNEIEEAAVIDGCSLFAMCRRVVIPVMRPVFATLLVFNVIYVWNEFPFAVTLINKASLTTIALGVSQFQGVYSIEYGAMMASATMVLIPQLVIYAIFQKQVVAGLTLGAVKG
jgi:raffinose/stachyose/melibiose transport system permease protein